MLWDAPLTIDVTPTIFRASQNLLNLLTNISPINGKNSDEKTQKTFYGFGLFVWVLSIFMNFCGVVGHWGSCSLSFTLTVMTFEWRFLHDTFKHIITVKKVRRLNIVSLATMMPSSIYAPLDRKRLWNSQCCCFLVQQVLVTGRTWRTIYETRFSRPKNKKSGNDVINKLWSIVAMDDFK